MINKEELMEIENGLRVTNDDGGDTGPVYTGGSDLPFGLDFPVDSFYTQNRTDGVLVWRKFGTDVNDWLVDKNTSRVDFVDYDIKVPSQNVYDLREREVNCELFVDGEVYVI
tara:strand:- start:143 stop:478 length:336 start_codon:yes stop_codon:yes gene_type:complete